MPIFLTAAATPLAHFAEGCILGATTYLVSRGHRSPVRSKKQ